ncbi:MAG: glycosyltransferase family 9 protein [Sedimentisphaerales bacterium]|jgi:lipopolysaccharide heptosyltransferase I
MTGEEPRRILIIKPSALGDIVLALPALSAMRRNFPQARISWLIRPEYAPLLEGNQNLTEIIPFDRKLYGRSWYAPRALGRFLRFIGGLRRGGFDTVVDLQGLFRTAGLGWLSGAKRRFGMANAREFGPLFYTHKVEQTEDCVHLVDYFLKIVGQMGATDLKVEFVLPRVKEAVDSIERILAQNNVPIEKYVVFVPGSAHKDKCWPRGRFAELAERIAERFGLAIVACGSAGEVNIVKEMKTLSRTPIVDLAGKTTLKELVELLREARLVVSNDTGPGHIAAALGTPMVMMFGWSNPARIMPYGRPECMAAREPYGRGTGIKSKDPRYSISEITVDEVFEKVFKQTKQR